MLWFLLGVVIVVLGSFIVITLLKIAFWILGLLLEYIFDLFR